jgi:hypothetical protein
MFFGQDLTPEIFETNTIEPALCKEKIYFPPSIKMLLIKYK